MERITSRQNPFLKQIGKLNNANPLCTHIRKLASSPSYRRSCGEFLCDSPKLLTEALLWKGKLKTVVCTEGTILPALPSGVRAVEVPGEVMKSISPAETPQGVLAICAMEMPVFPEILPGKRYVVLDGVQDPGNVGTILRTADAFCANGVFLVNACADLYNPKTVRATMGAVFRCPVWTCGAAELRRLLTELGATLGRFDLPGQLRGLDAAIRSAEESLRRLREGAPERRRSYQTLGLCTGAAVAILLL